MRNRTVMLEGRSVSGGIAVGRAMVRLDDPSVVPVYRLAGEREVEEEIQVLRLAIEKADRQAEADVQWAKGHLPESEAEIFLAQRAILRDPSLAEWVEEKIRTDRINAAAAVRRRFDEFRGILQRSSSDLIRNRILDVTDAEQLVLGHILGFPQEQDGEVLEQRTEQPVVLVTQNPPPSLLARADPRHVAGILCEEGAGMGHVAVLARALNLPALIQVEGLLAEVRDGDELALDGDRGRVTVNPGAEELKRFRAQIRRKRFLLPPQPSDPRAQRRTREGRRIYLQGNVSSREEVDAAAEVDADGVGLYRTEFFYLSRRRLPTEEELAAEYSAAAGSFTHDPVDIRLLDLGSDKHLPGQGIRPEKNPALGLRSLRFLFEHPEILRTQIRAVLQAAADGPLRLLLPMVSGVEDVRRIRELVSECHEELRREGLRHDPDLPVGAMIEHPAAVVTAEEIFREADFVSIGTNDLTMYLLAVDRDAAHLAGYYDPFHPAVIRVLGELGRLSRETHTPLSVCGEIAGDPTLTGLLVGLGLERLSMAPQWILPVGRGLARVHAGEWAALAETLTSLKSSAEIRNRVREAARGA